MTEHRRYLSTLLRFMAALALVIGAFAFTDAKPLAARMGSCAPASGAKCVASSGTVYDGKMCLGTQCMTCESFPGRICTGFGTDIEDYSDTDLIHP